MTYNRQDFIEEIDAAAGDVGFWKNDSRPDFIKAFDDAVGRGMDASEVGTLLLMGFAIGCAEHGS